MSASGATGGGFESDPFKDSNISSQFSSDPFAGEDPFKGGEF